MHLNPSICHKAHETEKILIQKRYTHPSVQRWLTRSQHVQCCVIIQFGICWYWSCNCFSDRPETDWVLPEPDQDRKSKLSFRFRFTGTGFSENQIPFRPDRISKFNRIPAGFQNSTRFLPDFQIQLDSYRNPKICRKITGIYNFAGFLLKF